MKHSKLKRAVAFALVFNITLQSTSIAQGLVASGLTRYLGGVGERIVEYVKSNYAFAADPDESQTEAPEGGGSGETGHGPGCVVNNITQVLDCKCDLAGTLSSAQSYADSAASSALSSAKSYADGAAKSALADANAYTDTAVNALAGALAAHDAHLTAHDTDMKTALSNIQTEIKTQGGSIKGAIDSFAEQNKTDHANLLHEIDDICSILGVPGYSEDETTVSIIDYLASINDWSAGISKTLSETLVPDIEDIRGDTDNMNSVLSALASSWFRIQPNENSGIEGTPSEEKAGKTYNMYYLVDKVHESTTVLVPSLGYGTVDDTGAYVPDKDGRLPVEGQLSNYIWTEMQQNSISSDLSQLNHNLYSNFGYHQYEITKENGSKLTLSEFQPSVAKDFATLISMFKNYHVAHVYSLNSIEDAPWQPTPDEISYAEERVLNKGYANAYLGFWAVDSSEYKPGYTARWEYILGKDILTPYEGYTISIHKNDVVQDNDNHKHDTEDSYNVTSNYVTSEAKNMVLDGELTLSDMFRILYRAVGQDIVTVNAVGIPDKSIIAETSPTSQGLSNISTLYGDSVYVYAIRNNLMENTTTGPRYYNLYLQQAKKDGFVGNISNEQAESYKVTWADVWYYAYAIMDRYGESVLNTTEIQSMLQLFGSNYPVQEGAVVADSWAYLMAKGCIAGNFSADANVVVEDFLDLAMRIADEDSRITYKNVQLVVALDEAVVDTGYFPVFNTGIKAVDQYTNKIEYKYDESKHYDTFVSIPGIDASKYSYKMWYLDSQGVPFEIPEEDETSYVGNASTKYFKFSMPFSREDISGVRIEGTQGNNKFTVEISNTYLGGGVVYTDLSGNMYKATKRVYFDDAYSSVYNSCVDTQRAQRTIKFAVAAVDATLLERIGHFFVYVFTPTKAYAALPMFTTTVMLDGGGPVNKKLVNNDTGSGTQSIYVLVESESIATACLIACSVSYQPSTAHKLYPMLSGIKSAWIETTNSTGTTGLYTMPEDKYKAWKEQSLTFAAYVNYYLRDWDRDSVITWDTSVLDEDTLKAYKAEIKPIHDKIYAQFFNKYNAALSKQDIPAIIKQLTFDKTDSRFRYQIVGSKKSALDEISAVLESNTEISVALLANVNEAIAEQQAAQIVQGSTTNGVGSITHVSSMYADAIMHRDSTYFVSYASLVEQGIVSTQKQPVVEDGILTFYLTNRGRVTIDVVNHIVMINSVYIDYGESEPIFIADDVLYINYSCLIGSGIKYGDKEVEAVEGEATTITTTTGSGTNATYQVATGIAAIEGTSAKSLNYNHYENKETTLYQYYLNSYGGKATSDLMAKKKPNDKNASVPVDIVLLSGVFPIGNWAVVEQDTGVAYAYTFYNKGIYLNEYFAESLYADEGLTATYEHLGITPKEGAKADKIPWNSLLEYDKQVAEVFSAEKGLLSRVLVEKGTVLDKLVDIYGIDIESATGNNILASTYYALAKLTEETGVLINNPDWYVRRFPVELTNTVYGLQVGKIYYLTNVGYIYVAPRYSDLSTAKQAITNEDTSPILKFATAEYTLPYYTISTRASKTLYDFNTNAYKLEVDSIDTTLPYGYTISTGDSTEFYDYAIKYDNECSYTAKKKLLDNKTNVIPAPAGIFRFLLSSEAVDSVIIGSLTKYSTQAASFYYGTKQLVYHEEGTDTTSMSFTEKGGKQQVAAVLKTDTAFVSTRDYKGKHHFILQPSMTPPSKVVIKPVDANSYITGYSDNPIYGSIKQWISDLDDTTTFLLQIIFYFMPYVMLIWVLLLICLAIIPHHTVLSVSKLIGVDLVSFLTLGRREVTNWHGYKVTIPLIIAFVSIGLFYGPNLLRIIEIVSKWAYDIAGLS